MDCPVCKNAMVALELQQVEVDHCFSCGGVWLDAGELELLIDDPVRAAKLLESFRPDTTCKEEKHRCPICRRKMEKVNVGKNQPKLLIDSCPKKHGLWFDGGELQGILERAQLDSDNNILRLLAEIFSNQKPNA